MEFLRLFAQQIDTTSLPHVGVGGDSSPVKVILNIVFSIAGAIAVFMISYGGFRFVISRGNPDAAAKARNTVIYAVVGLVIVLLAFAVVNFVIGKI